jgi:hypothetical protein
MNMIQLSLGCTGAILIVMGIMEAFMAAGDVAETGGGRLMKPFILFYGLLLAALGLSIAAMRGNFQGQGLFLTVMALIIAGPFFLVFPSRPRALFLEMIRGMEKKFATALVVFDSVLRLALGAAFLFFAFRAGN